MGLTLLAAGTSIPDTVASVMVAREGKHLSLAFIQWNFVHDAWKICHFLSVREV